MLSDIGLERGDLSSLRAGLVTLEQLGQKRSSSHRLASQEIQPKVDKETQARLAANQDRLLRLCA
jgi:hypothetical protein